MESTNTESIIMVVLFVIFFFPVSKLVNACQQFRKGSGQGISPAKAQPEAPSEIPSPAPPSASIS